MLRHAFFVVGCLWLFLVVHPAHSQEFNASEYSALKDLYDSTRGEYWRWHGVREHWDFSDPQPCLPTPWQGLTCVPSNTNIQEITLSLYNLSGSLPESLGNLSELQYLYLSFNGLTGSLPESLGNLSELQYLDLSNNGLTGSLPESLGNLTKLQDIDLSDNGLTGSLPESLGNLAELQYLELYHNGLTGSLPESLGNLAKLQDLEINNNGLNGSLPESLGNLAELQYLSICYNSFTGSLPESLGGLSELQFLDFHMNDLNGSLPESLGNLSNLRVLALSSNGLTGSLPEQLTNLKKLQDLDLSNNGLTGSLPQSPGNLARLKYLDLSNNGLTGSLPQSPGNLARLKYLDLSNNGLTGSLPESLGDLRKMLVLTLCHNDLNGSLPESLGILSKLIFLALDNNGLTGTLPESLGNLAKLKYLYLFNNGLAGSLPESLGNLAKLQNLWLHNNGLAGSLPESLGNLALLRELRISNNFFSGNLRSLLFNKMVLLESVDISSNYFIGSVPTLHSIKLSQFDISKNAFTGAIPEFFFELPELKNFSASVNCISRALPSILCESSSLEELLLCGLHQSDRCASDEKGDVELPACVWNMNSLKRLYLAGNGYTGNMDNFNLTNLVELSIGYNHLRGTLPTILNRQHMQVFDVSNNMLTGRLYDIAVAPLSNTSTFKAEINRFSGPLSTQAIEKFSSAVSILNGNVFSCSNLPQNDDGKERYSCGSLVFEYSIYYWCILFSLAVGVIFFITYSGHETIKRCSDWWTKYLNTDILCYDESKMQLPTTNYMLSSLKRLLYVSFIIAFSLVVATSIVYFSLKYSKSANYYRTHTDQYQYTISGVYLKTAIPAVCLYILHTIAIGSIVYAFFRIFVEEWKILRLKHLHIKSSSEKKYEIESSFELFCSLGYRFVCVSMFIVVSILTNVGYIFLRDYVNDFQLLLLQLALLVLNACFRVSIPFLISHLFREDGKKLYDSYSVKIMAGLLTFIDIAVPFTATLISSDLCIHQIVFDDIEDISVDTTVTQCAIHYYKFGPCAQYQDFGGKLTFQPPFRYSGQCRNAIFTAFLPVVIQSCAFEAFVNPFLYFFVNYRLVDLNANVSFLGIPFKAREFVLPDMMYSLVVIWGEFLLLLTYGIISPYAAFAIGMNICSQIFMLRFSICRYYHLQFVESDSKTLDNDPLHIENICENCHANTEAMIWPGLIISTILFSLYVFDMAYDTDDRDVGPALGVMIATIVVLPIIRLCFYHFTSKLQSRLERNISDMNKREERGFVDTSMTEKLLPENSEEF